MTKRTLVVCPGCGKERNIFVKRGGHLYCKSCATMERYGKDYVGKIYGRLTIVSDAEPVFDKNGKRRAFVNCLCSCGNQAIVDRNKVTSGETRSCGCLREEIATVRIHELHKKYEKKLTDSEKEELKLSRKGKEYRGWIREVKSTERCVICGSSQNLAAHHLESYRDNPELRFEPTNGVCLCAKCHVEYHTHFLGGYHVSATITTFDEFMRIKNGETDDE